MSAITETKDRMQGQLVTYSRILKQKILGVNNEHLDFVMDSFYKLNPNQRNGVLAFGVGAIVMFVMGAFFLYFIQVQSLKGELNETFRALNELKVLKVNDSIESERFTKLVELVGRKTRSLNFKPFFEKLSQDAKIPIRGLAERTMDIDPNNPLAEMMKEVHVEMKLSKVSIPRLLSFLVDIEKSGQFLRVQNLKITGIYGNKLYFDVEILVRGYKVNR